MTRTELCVLAVLAVFVAVGIWWVTNHRPQRDKPYVLTVVSTRLTGGDRDSVSMQEFSSRLSCSYALGYVQGATTKLIAECLEK